MTKGMKAYEGKQLKAIRRRNHIQKDLASTKYRQRIRQGKPPNIPPEIDEWDEDEEEYPWNDEERADRSFDDE